MKARIDFDGATVDPFLWTFGPKAALRLAQLRTPCDISNWLAEPHFNFVTTTRIPLQKRPPLQTPGYRTETARASSALELAAIRVVAMRASLEAMGRFDPERAAQRFLSAFIPEDTEILYIEDRIAGFYVLRRHPDHLYLDHLYLSPDFQGLGLGGKVIAALQDQARSAGLPIRLMALNGSPANDFYRRAGFRLVSFDALDSTYIWHPAI